MLREVRRRAQKVINDHQVRSWIAEPRPHTNWRDIIRQGIAVYEDRFGIYEEYSFFRQDGTLPLDAEYLTVHTDEAAARTVQQINQSRPVTDQLVVHRRLVGRWERLDQRGVRA